MSAVKSNAIRASESNVASLGLVPAVDAADQSVEPPTVGPSRKAKLTAGQRVGRGVLSALPPLAVLVVIFGIWYAAHAVLGARGFLMPTPDQVLTQGFMDADASERITIGVLRTTGVAVTGLLIASALGIAWATAMTLARWVQRSTYPYAVILQCVPILALVPLIGVWFGYEFNARVVVCVIIALFPMVANTLFGLQSADKSQHELFKLQRASRWTVLSKLMFPAALPSIFVGLRTSAGLSVVGAIVGDMFFQRGQVGIGNALQVFASRVEYAELFAAIIVASLLGVAMFGLFGLLAKLAVGKWYEPAN